MSLKKIMLITLTLFTTTLQANGYFRIPPKHVTPYQVKVFTNAGNWIVEKNNEYMVIDTNDVDLNLQTKNIENLSNVIKSGYIRIAPCGNSYKIYYSARGIGGGPLTGWFGYWVTKGVAYGGAGAVTAVSVIAAAPVGGIVTTAATGATAAVAAGAVTGAGVAGAVSGVAATATAGALGATAGAVEIVAGGMIIVEGAAGFVVAVESTSLTVGAILTACPFLP